MSWAPAPEVTREWDRSPFNFRIWEHKDPRFSQTRWDDGTTNWDLFQTRWDTVFYTYEIWTKQ